jgi:hypothetical protein
MEKSKNCHFSSVTRDYCEEEQEQHDQQDFDQKMKWKQRHGNIEKDQTAKNRNTYSWASSVLFGANRLLSRNYSNDHDQYDLPRNDKDTTRTRNDAWKSTQSDEHSLYSHHTRQTQPYFDLHLPDPETKTQISQITMDGMEWTKDRYQDSNLSVQQRKMTMMKKKEKEKNMDRPKSRHVHRIQSDLDLAMNKIPSRKGSTSRLGPPKKRSSSMGYNNSSNSYSSTSDNAKFDSTELCSSRLKYKSAMDMNDGFRSVVVRPGVSSSHLEPKAMISRQTMMKEWRDFVNEQHIYTWESQDKSRSVQCVRSESPPSSSDRLTREKRDSKSKVRNGKSDKALMMHPPMTRRGRKDMDEMSRSINNHTSC